MVRNKFTLRFTQQVLAYIYSFSFLDSEMGLIGFLRLYFIVTSNGLNSAVNTNIER